MLLMCQCPVQRVGGVYVALMVGKAYRCAVYGGWNESLVVEEGRYRAVEANKRERVNEREGIRRSGQQQQPKASSVRMRVAEKRGANPFKSTQLRQWGFICYLEGHIVSPRERTDRLRRASDSAASTERSPIYLRPRHQRNDFIILLFILRPPSP